jgi:hypothetical protein
VVCGRGRESSRGSAAVEARMASYKFLVLTNPNPGREHEYNRWYDEIHLGDVVDVPGFVAAQRFRIEDAESFSGYRYLSIYDIESDDPKATFAALTARAGTDAMVISEALDPNASLSLWRSIGPVVTADGRKGAPRR